MRIVFHLRCRAIHLTYRSRVDLDSLLDWLVGTPENPGRDLALVAYSAVVNESGHTSVLLQFESDLVTGDCRYFDFQGAHPNLKVVSSRSHWVNVVRLHQRLGEPVTDGDLSGDWLPERW